MRDGPATVTAAQDLLDRRFPFAAHEVFEARWKRCPPEERDLWQGLAQLCVAVTHQERGNSVGAQRLRERAAQHLAQRSSEIAAESLRLNRSGLLTWLSAPPSALPPLSDPSA